MTGTDDNAVSYFRFPSCEFEKVVTRGQHPVRHLGFDPKGKFLAVGFDDGSIRMTNIQAPQMFIVLKAHTDSVIGELVLIRYPLLLC